MPPLSRIISQFPIYNQRGRDITPISIDDGQRFMIPLTKGHFALVDAQDLHKVYRISWYAQKGARGNVYAGAVIGTDPNGKLIHLLMHRLIKGVTDPKIEVDHINRDQTLNNTRANLREADKSGQGCNAERPRAKTGYRGVAPAHDTPGSFTAHVDWRGKRHQCGTFRSAIEAARARDMMALRIQGKFATLNFPLSDYE